MVEEVKKMKIRFLGAAGQVTGSSYLLEAAGRRLLIDCGLFQERPYLERNWSPFPVPPDSIDTLLLTHAHLDHAGLIPKLVREGFSGRILTTAASAEILPLILRDSARIQEEDAAYKKKRHTREGRKGPYPLIPLYTEKDVENALPLLKPVPYQTPISLGKNISVRFYDAGHILGSAMLELQVTENGGPKRVIFSGDIGQWDKPLVRDPSVFEEADVVVMESTYGDRNHEDTADKETLLAGVINETVKAGGNIIIPVFAVERAQELMYHLSLLIRDKRIPRLLTFLDSPLAVDITAVFERHPEFLDEETRRLLGSGREPLRFPGLKLIHTREDSKAINQIKGSCIIMAGSGMCTGGRVKHHLTHNISRPESTILFVGYQAEGTLGREILERRPVVRILGRLLAVRARVEQIHGFSGHADQRTLLRWLDNFRKRPSRLFLTHGDKNVILSFAAYLENERGWNNICVPDYNQEWQSEGDG